MKQGRLGFNPENGRYGVLSIELWEDTGLHCGECLAWFDRETGEWLQDRIEGIHPADNPNNWYIAISGIRGRDLEYLQVRIY